jgi:hypothetical protein
LRRLRLLTLQARILRLQQSLIRPDALRHTGHYFYYVLVFGLPEGPSRYGAFFEARLSRFARAACDAGIGESPPLRTVLIPNGAI